MWEARNPDLADITHLLSTLSLRTMGARAWQQKVLLPDLGIFCIQSSTPTVLNETDLTCSVNRRQRKTFKI